MCRFMSVLLLFIVFPGIPGQTPEDLCLDAAADGWGYRFYSDFGGLNRTVELCFKPIPTPYNIRDATSNCDVQAADEVGLQYTGRLPEVREQVHLDTVCELYQNATFWMAAVDTSTCSLQTLHYNVPLAVLPKFYDPEEIPINSDDVDNNKRCLAVDCTGSIFYVRHWNCAEELPTLCVINLLPLSPARPARKRRAISDELVRSGRALGGGDKMGVCWP